MDYKVILESSIMQKGRPATAGSKMLENFISPVDATVVERLEAAGLEITGRIGMSEFGASGLFSDAPELTETVNNFKAGTADVILCNDYTGAVSCAAAASGLYYIHPTYGTVSRYGLVPAVTSMDQIGILCKTPEVGFSVLQIIGGYDHKDGVMEKEEREKAAEVSPGEKSETLKSPRKIKVDETELMYSEIYSQIMQILCCAELGNNINRYDGIKFGYRAKEYNGLRELYTKSRTEAFGEDVKLAALIGAMVLSQENYNKYYDKAMRLRRMIKESVDFSKYDVIKTSNPILSRLTGLPSLSTPGFVYTANKGQENILSALADDPGEQTI